MKFIHTSDWHLGHSLHGRQRHAAFEAFLDWLLELLRTEQADALLVAGDVFDSSLPGTRAQELYYRFLARLRGTGCRHAVITAGNHDSPSFLEAPRGLLRECGIHVLGLPAAPEQMVLTLRDAANAPEAIICAVPYLRERDLRGTDAGESMEDKARKLVEGARAHYAAVGQEAMRRLAALEKPVPVIGMGHLFATGGQVSESERALYVGTLGQLPADIFPACMDYVALGHLHARQCVGGQENRRYCGAPLALDFGGAALARGVCVVDCTADGCTVRQADAPVFQRLAHLEGDWDTLAARLLELRATEEPVWLEVVYTGAELLGDLRDRVDAAVRGSALEVLRVRDARLTTATLEADHEGEALDELDAYDVFERCLTAHAIPDAQRAELRHSYQEIVRGLDEADHAAGQEG